MITQNTVQPQASGTPPYSHASSPFLSPCFPPLPFCVVCSGATTITLLQFPPKPFCTRCFPFPSIYGFFTNPGFLFSPSTLSPWLFYPSFFFRLLIFVFFTFPFAGGGGRNIDRTVALSLLPSSFSLLFMCTLLVTHIDVQTTCALLLTHTQFFAGRRWP